MTKPTTAKRIEPILEMLMDASRHLDAVKFTSADALTLQDAEIWLAAIDVRNSIYRLLAAARDVRG